VPLDRRLEPHSCPPTTPPPAPHTPSLHDALPIYWYGVTPAALDKAKQQAGRDYVVFVVDMYGKGVRPADDKQALAQVQGLYPKPDLMRARMQAALDAFKAQAGKAPLDAARIGAFGFCFGGSSVLELARSGAALAGIAT